MTEINKSQVAKLLATENITVVQEDVKTASFDVKNRVLTLPIWRDMEPFTYDHLIGHEVGHALYTPMEGWHDAVCEKGPAFKGYLNIVEDARIEKLVQRKYPGLRGPFIRSYRKMLNDGFFGVEPSRMNSMNLIDRLNIYFKCGASAGVRIDKSEMVWVNRINKAETWEDVVAIATELYGNAEKQAEEEHLEMLEEMVQIRDEDGEEFEDGDDFTYGSGIDDHGDDNDEHGFDDESYDEGGADEEQEEESTPGDQMFNSGSEGGKVNTPVTDRILRYSIEKDFNRNIDGKILNLTVNKHEFYRDRIIDYKTVLAHLAGEKDAMMDDYGIDDSNYFKQMKEPRGKIMPRILYEHWSQHNKKSVNHMVKEFEMFKSASDYHRGYSAKTGVLDTVKMNRYRITDDIFKKVTIVPEGKNHGFIMYLDMSGSMASYIYQTIEQLLLLTHFTKQIGVPFRVYGFTNQFGKHKVANSNMTPEEVGYSELWSDDCILLELFSSEMTRPHMVKMSGLLLMAYARNADLVIEHPDLKKLDEDFQSGYSWRPWQIAPYSKMTMLGGTPMDGAIALGVPLAKDFRKKYRVDILNTIFLTDGASHDMSMGPNSGEYDARQLDHMNRYWPQRDHVTITNPWTNRNIRVRNTGGMNMTPYLLNIYKEATGSSVVGYRIERQTKWAVIKTYEFLVGGKTSWNEREAIATDMRDHSYVKVTDPEGYDECYILGDKSLRLQESELSDDLVGESKAKLRTAFKKSLLSHKKSRKMLTDLVKRVA